MTVFAGVDLLIGIDDTDDQFSPGTGRRARALLRELAAAGLGSEAGATRHQPASSQPGLRPASPRQRQLPSRRKAQRVTAVVGAER